MESLVRVALVGTARQGTAPTTGGAGAAPTDGLVARLGDLDAERSLLLRAGALAAYRVAGRAPGGVVDPLVAAPDETAPYCAPAAADLIGRILENTHPELLPEALDRLRRAGLILPPELLVAALSTRQPEFGGIRAALADALGARGRWLAARNPAWGWVREALDEREPPSTDADAIWEEGDAKQRRSIFRCMRRADPAHAREWLAATWAREKADMRDDLMGLLNARLSVEDEPLLTQALADRNDNVRQQAARLLARLPASAFAARMRERADAMLGYAAGVLQVTLPAAFDPAWARDYIKEEVPHGVGKRAWWLVQILGFVPPAHWSERFGASPAHLAAAASATDHEGMLIEGWSQAAVLHQDTAWAPAPWVWWESPRRGITLAEDEASELHAKLGALVPHALAEERIARLLGDPTDPAYALLEDLVSDLPAPWSPAFGARLLEAVRAASAGVGGTPANPSDWDLSMQRAVSALPPDCFAAALAPWVVHEPEQQAGLRWQRQIERFTEALDIRRQVIEAIPIDE